MPAQVFLRKHIQNRIGYFHPWVYANEIGQTEGEVSPGAIVDVFSHLGSFVGQGFFNPYASVRIKMFSFKNKVDFNEAYLRGLIERALKYRKEVGYGDIFRLFNSDGDGMPGLIIDHFPTLIVFQTISLGIDYYKDLLVKVLSDLFPDKDIFEQNEVFVRNLEGLRLQRVVHRGEDVEDLKKGYPYEMLEAQFKLWPGLHDKTGVDWENMPIWTTIKPFVKEGPFLNLFSGMGELSVLAKLSKAKECVAVDYNAQQIQLSKEQEKLNGVSDISWIHQNVFDYLKTSSYKIYQWQAVVVNPPALIHKKEQLHKAYAAYKEMLIRLLPQIRTNGVILVSFPHHLYESSWVFELMHEVMRDVKLQLRLLKELSTRWDHPNPASFLQNRAFKAYLWQVN